MDSYLTHNNSCDTTMALAAHKNGSHQTIYMEEKHDRANIYWNYNYMAAKIIAMHYKTELTNSLPKYCTMFGCLSCISISISCQHQNQIILVSQSNERYKYSAICEMA